MWFLWIPEVKEWLVICNKEDTDGRAGVTADEKRVLQVDWTEIRLYLSFRKIVVERVAVVSLEWTIEAEMVLAVLESR